VKLIVALLMSTALFACGGKKKENTTPTNNAGTTETKPDEGSGSAKPSTPAPASGADPCAGQ
jgi:hypothetical protein